MSRVSVCRSCGAFAEERGTSQLVPVLDLGRTPLANRLLNANQLDELEPTYSLELAFCPCCSLLQITETVSAEDLFRDYVYFSSFSDTMLRHSERIAKRLISEHDLDSNSLVVEAASNDGYLLQHFVNRGVPVLGIEPARNIARVAREKGIPTVDEFFGAELAERLRSEGIQADVFLANNVLAHVADLNGFVRGIRTVLAPNGRAVIEAPYAKDMIDHIEFDTIYHEHIFYFTVTSLARLFRRHGLEITHVDRVPIHGGSLQITVAHMGVAPPSDAVSDLLAEEQHWGVDRVEFYQQFGHKVEGLKSSLLKLLGELKGKGKRLAAYGASAKGSTLLNYFGIGRETIEFVVDRSPHKQNRYTPGTHLPILPPEQLTEAMPDYVLLLTWNFADEILEQQAAYRRKGGKFIIPIPEATIV